MDWLVRMFLRVACIGSVMFTPGAHTLKTVIGGDTRYNGIVVTEKVRKKITDDDLILFGDDRFMPPFLDLIAKKYKGDRMRQLHWIFPTLMGDRALEEVMVKGFVCLIAGNKTMPIVWLLNRDRYDVSQGKGRKVSIEVETFHRHLLVDFVVDDVLYDVHDSIFLRGSIARVVAAGDDDRVRAVLYPNTLFSSKCANKKIDRTSTSMSKSH